MPSWDGPHSDGQSGSFAAARSLKRELLAELREGWEQGRPVAPEELLGRWPGGPGQDRDAASVLFEDYLQRRERSVVVAPAEADAKSAAGAAVVTPPSLEEYEQRFPKQKDSLRAFWTITPCCNRWALPIPAEPAGFAWRCRR